MATVVSPALNLAMTKISFSHGDQTTTLEEHTHKWSNGHGKSDSPSAQSLVGGFQWKGKSLFTSSRSLVASQFLSL